MSKLPPLLKVRGLKKYFPIYSGIFRRQIGDVKAVDGIDLDLSKGEILGIVGESGCGKSTLGRCILRLIEPTEGEIFFQKEDLMAKTPSQIRHLRKDMQMVFQNPYSALNPRKTIAVNLGEAALYHGIVRSYRQRDEYVVDLLESVKMSSDALNRYPHEFSGGQQQRLCIGRALALKPKLIICDEAVSALDVSVQAQVLNLLFELKEKFQLSYLFISHDLSVVRHFCDRILVLHFGKLVEQGSSEEIFNKAQHPYTQKLIASIPTLDMF